MENTYGNKAKIRYLPYNKISNIIYTGKYNLLLNILNTTTNRYCLLWHVTYCRQPHDFKTCRIRRGRNVLFLSPTDMGSHNTVKLTRYTMTQNRQYLAIDLGCYK